MIVKSDYRLEMKNKSYLSIGSFGILLPLFCLSARGIPAKSFLMARSVVLKIYSDW
jgi:hypothetical protein